MTMAMKLHRWDDLRRRKLTPEQLAKIDREVAREVLDMNLREIREFAGKTQVEVAKEGEMAQSEVSRAERREDHLLSSLKRYVEALGGELEVIARFGDKTIRLRGV